MKNSFKAINSHCLSHSLNTTMAYSFKIEYNFNLYIWVQHIRLRNPNLGLEILIFFWVICWLINCIKFFYVFLYSFVGFIQYYKWKQLDLLDDLAEGAYRY